MSGRIAYDTRLQAVSDALEQVEAPGDYCKTGAHASFPLPGLVVDGVGEILLPLAESTARVLISASHLAPFGHGEHTLVDTQVRNTWELSTGQFKIENPVFTAFVTDQIAEACRGPLGIHESVVFEAKLYKLLLYETGGKFERHQDSEKESGMFGTLVVVLPGRFEGGELVVHDPSVTGESKKAVSDVTRLNADVCVFDAGAMDPLSIKYAAFYGDCPHEVRPVTKGYRLCLTYNFVKVASPSMSIADPQFGSNHALYAKMKDALERFFCADGVDQKKRQRIDTEGSSAAVGFDVTNPDMFRQCKLVYVLTHKYTQANLSFDNLKNRDAAVAASLAHFCQSSDGALGMILCKMRYRFSWHGEEGTMYDSDADSENDCGDDDDDDGDRGGDITRKLDLLCPWVEYSTDQSAPNSGKWNSSTFSEGDMTAEVAPYGFFEKKGFTFDGVNSSEYTGNEGASSDRWYGSAAVVVAPLQLRVDWVLRFQEHPVSLLEMWLEVAGSKPAQARTIALAFQNYVFKCSATSALGVRVLEIAARMDDLDFVCTLMVAFRPVEFQPKLREVLSRFDAVQAVETAIAKHMSAKGCASQRSTTNFVASILDGVTDSSVIAVALDMIDAVPFVDSNDMDELTFDEAQDTPPEEFARLLKLASLVSSDRVKSIVEVSTKKELVLVVAPAVQLLFDATKDDPNECAVVVAAANQVLDVLKLKIPKLRNSSYKWNVGCRDGSSCACECLRAFMRSLDEETTFDKKVFDEHIKVKLEKAGGLDLFGVEQRGENDGSTVVLKKTYESAVFKRAQQEIAKLEKLAAEFVRVAVVTRSE